MTTADDPSRHRLWEADLGPAAAGASDFAVGVVGGALQWLGFWTAIALPLSYLYLFVNGLTAAELIWLVQLLGLHLVALAVGRGHKAESTGTGVSTYRDGNQST